jgi:phage terminase large subunit-like protein
VATLAELRDNLQHPQRGRWLAELARRTEDNERLKEKRDRLEATAWDMLAFGQVYLGHYFSDAPAEFHRELVDLLQAIDEMEWFKTRTLPDGTREKRIDPSTGQPSTKAGIVVAAPRGHAKSTLLTLLIPLYCACFRLRKFIVIISDSDVQVKSFCSDIKREIEENDLIRQDFGDISGSAWGRKWTGEDFIVAHGEVDERGRKKTAHEMRIVGRSTNARMRGLRNRESRPDLVIVDDMENDTHVETPEMREKMYAKLNGAVIPMLDPHHGIFLFCGTVLHFDSVLSRLLEQSMADSYVQRRWSAITNGKDVFDDTATPLWPRRFPLEFLRVKRSQMPVRQFNQEYLNNPHDPETRDFRPEWLQWYHGTHLLRIPKSGVTMWRSPHWEAHPVFGEQYGDGYQELVQYNAIDPAISQEERADYFALVNGGLSAESEDIVVLWIVHDRLNFAEQVAEIFLSHRQFPRTRMTGIEAINYQEALKQVVDNRTLKRLKGSKVPIRPIKHRTGPKNKEARLRRRAVECEAGYVWLRELWPGDEGYDEAPWDETGLHKIHPNHYPLYQEMMRFPHAAHDDVLDAFDMLVELMGRKKMFEDFAAAERQATGGRVPTTRTKGRRAEANVPGLDPEWEPAEAA